MITTYILDQALADHRIDATERTRILRAIDAAPDLMLPAFYDQFTQALERGAANLDETRSRQSAAARLMLQALRERDRCRPPARDAESVRDAAPSHKLSHRFVELSTQASTQAADLASVYALAVEIDNAHGTSALGRRTLERFAEARLSAKMALTTLFARGP